MSRFVILSIILILIDLLAFQAVRSILGNSGRVVKMVVYIVYWAIPVITIMYMVGINSGWIDQFPKGIKLTLRSLIFIVYFAKLLIAMIILIDDLRRLIFGALNLGWKDWQLSTERSIRGTTPTQYTPGSGEKGAS